MKILCVMYKSSNKRNKHSPENIIDRVISKLRMAKRGSQRTTDVSQAEAPEKQGLSNPKPMAFDSHKYHEEVDVGENLRVSLHDLSVFCDQLERFIKYVRNVQDLQFLTYDYPQVVQNRYENGVIELESMLKEINASLTNIRKQKAQTSFVEKEKTAIKKTLKRLKDDAEFREMENVVAMYDKALFLRWENVKNTHKPQLFKNLLTEIKCKQLALNNLDTLVTRKLGYLKKFSSLIGSGHDKVEKSIIPLPFPPLCPTFNARKSRIPQQPLLPPPPTLASMNNGQSSSMQIRRRLEREEDISEDNVCFAASDIDAIDLPVIPPMFNNIPDNLIVSLNENSHREVSSASYITSNGTGSQGELTAGLQEEMRTVLQALFGDMTNRNLPSNH